MCLAQGHNAVMIVKLKPATPQSRVKHSTTEPLLSSLASVLFGFLDLRPKSTAMVNVGQSVHLTTLFPGQA